MRCPDIDQPWPVEGTLNPEVIKIIKVLAAIRLSRRKAKRDRDTGKRQTELGHFSVVLK